MKMSDALKVVADGPPNDAEDAVCLLAQALMSGVRLPEDPLADRGVRGMMAVPADLDARHEKYGRAALAVERRLRGLKAARDWAEAVLEDRAQHVTRTDEGVQNGKNAEIRKSLLAGKTEEATKILRKAEADVQRLASARAQLVLVEARLQYAKEVHAQQVRLAEVERGLTPKS